MMEMINAMFEPQSVRIEPSKGKGLLSREQILGALGVIAGKHPLGWAALQAEHTDDTAAHAQLAAHLRTELAAHCAECAELPEMALAVYLRRPLPEQLASLVAKHPRWDRERRRAAKVKVLIQRAKERGNQTEVERLQGEHDKILSAARARCEREILDTGRCPKCAGTGAHLRKGTQCAVCHGTGRVVPDMAIIERKVGQAAAQAVHRVLDELGSAVSAFSRAMRQRLEGEREPLV